MDSRIIYILCALLLTASAITQRIVGFPRPWWQFALLTLPLVVLLAHVIISPRMSTKESLATLSLATLSGAWLRVSGYLSLVSAGRDTQMWLSTTRSGLETGMVPSGGMYGASPLHIIDMMVGILIYGVDLFGARYVTIASASTLPVLLFAITWRLTHETRPALIAGILTATFPLFIRTAPLLESEGSAVTWFATLLLLTVVTLLSDGRRAAAIATGLLLASAYLHFFYSTLFAIWAVGVGVLCLLAQEVISPRVGITTPKPTLIWVALPAMVLIPFHILWSGWGHQGAGVLVGLLNVTLPSDPISAFLPSTGAAGTSVGSGENGGAGGDEPWFAPAVTVGSVAMYLAFAAIGGLVLLRSISNRSVQVAVGGAATIITMTIGVTVAGIGYNLNFRLFYFVGIFAVIFGAIAIISIADVPRIRSRPVALALLCVIVGLAMIGSPMSAMGNNIDSPVSNESWALTQDDSEQAEAIHDTAGVSESDVDEINIRRLYENPDDTGVLSDEPCTSGSATVADTGEFNLCLPDDQTTG